MSKNVITAFPTPVLYYNTGIDTERYVSLSDKIEFRRDVNMDTSVDTYILDMPEFADLKKVVEQAVKTFTKDVCSISDKFEFYITNSWYNKYHQGDRLDKHFHNNSIISGSLYLRANKDSGHLLFHNDYYNDQLFPPNIQFEYDTLNMFNSPTTALLPMPGDIVLFTSHFPHSVETNRSTELRHCLPFNVFVKGSFGNVHKLELK